MPLTKEQKEIIGRLISNEGIEDESLHVWNVDDQAALENLAENVPGKLTAFDAQRAALANNRELVANNGDEEHKEETDAAKKKKPLMNQQPKPQTDEEWLASAPEGIRSVVSNAMRMEERAKNDLIDQITENEHNAFTKEYLSSLDVEELEGIAALATNGQSTQTAPQRIQVLNYGGVAHPTTMVSNLEEDFNSQDADLDPEPISWN